MKPKRKYPLALSALIQSVENGNESNDHNQTMQVIIYSTKALYLKNISVYMECQVIYPSKILAVSM